MVPNVLVVLDVETRFKSAYGAATLRNILREARDAMALGCPVIVIRTPKPNIHSVLEPKLESLVQGYDKVEFREKLDSDGTDQILLACHHRGWQTQRYRLVGVRTDCGVLKTALGLAERRPNHVVEVIQNACETDYEDDCWELFDEPNIKLLAGGEVIEATPADGA